MTEASNGEEALQRVAEAPVDVILLDVMMPKIDGFEVCQQLKNDPQTAIHTYSACYRLNRPRGAAERHTGGRQRFPVQTH